MRIIEVDNNIIAIYPGRFQPPHKGHFAVYKWLSNKFGKANTFIATSNKTDFTEYGKILKTGPNKGQEKTVSNPLSFDEKQYIWNKMFGVKKDHVIECENPAFIPFEILNNHDRDKSFVVAVGNKDIDRYEKSSWWQLLPQSLDDLKPANQCGYYLPLPIMEGGINASKVRKSLSTNQPLNNMKAFKILYNRFDADVYTIITNKLTGRKYEWQ